MLMGPPIGSPKQKMVIESPWRKAAANARRMPETEAGRAGRNAAREGKSSWPRKRIGKKLPRRACQPWRGAPA